MVEPNHSEIENEDMDKLQLSSDSIDNIPTNKRLRTKDSEDETDFPAKKRQMRMVIDDDAKSISDNIEELDAKEEYTLNSENEQIAQDTLCKSDTNVENKNEQHGKLKQKDENESSLNDNNVLNSSSEKINIEENIDEKEDTSFEKSVTNTDVMSTLKKEKETRDSKVIKLPIIKQVDEKMDEKEDCEEDEMKKQHVTKIHIKDTEVVDGLELSVECASDKDESSSTNENEKDIKPRVKTIIVKAEPNESELDCSSNEDKSDSQQALIDTSEIKSEKKKTKRKSSRTSFSKLKLSGSEDSQNSNSDEDYSPRTTKKMKRSPPATRKSTNKHHSKRGRVKGTKGNSYKKSSEHVSDEDEDANVEKTDKSTKTKNGVEKESSEKESSKDESDSNSESEEKSMKDKESRRSNTKSQDNYTRQIQSLKRYLNVAGIKVRNYNEIWADCKSNNAKIKRLKELLEKNGVNGKPSLQKCKRVREKNEKMKEVSELDTSNIISEGRVTRARKNLENIKKTPPETPPRHREARNTFRRIQTVVDSDSE